MSREAFTPRQHNDKTTQSCGTPREFLTWLENFFGVTIGFDLACTTKDCVARSVASEEIIEHPGIPTLRKENIKLSGYFHDKGVDALTQDWSAIPYEVAYLNPDFERADEWARKCREHQIQRTMTSYLEEDTKRIRIKMTGPRVFSLLPAAVGSEWCATYVAPYAAVYFPRPRICFIDPATGEPMKLEVRKRNKQTGLMEGTGKFIDGGINRDCMLVDWGNGPISLDKAVVRWRERKERPKRPKRRRMEQLVLVED